MFVLVVIEHGWCYSLCITKICLGDESKMNTDFSQISQIDLRPFIPIIVLATLLSVVALIDLIRYRKERKNFWIWFIIILFVNTIGSILYFIFGRKDKYYGN